MKKYLLYQVSCRNCGFENKVISIYDWAWMKSKKSMQPASADLYFDPVFNEVTKLVAKNLGISEFKAEADIQKLHYVFAKTCDAAPDGSEYVFDRVWCIRCGSTDVKFGPTNPKEEVETDVPEVSHNEWEKLGEAEKEDNVTKWLATNTD